MSEDEGRGTGEQGGEGLYSCGVTRAQQDTAAGVVKTRRSEIGPRQVGYLRNRYLQ